MKSKALTITLGLFVVLLLITASIALPIYFRPFYYWQVDSLQIPAITGYDRDTVIAAYDEVLDYLTLPGAEFSTGVFPHTAEGADHFADCKALFTLNTTVLILSFVMVVLLTWLCRRGWFRLWYPRGFHITFWAGCGVLTAFATVGLLVARDFDRAFVVFHQLFFPGKENWVFDIHADAIINALPQEFFMHCAALILCSVVVTSIMLILCGVCRRKRT